MVQVVSTRGGAPQIKIRVSYRQGYRASHSDALSAHGLDFGVWEMDLTLKHWNTQSVSDREKTARQLVKVLPSGFKFAVIKRFRLGGLQRQIALFRFKGATFCLVPGGHVTLGFDSERPWKPTPEERSSWRGTAKEYGLKQTIHEMIVESTLRTRSVDLAPLLVENEPRELAVEKVSLDDPEVQEVLRNHRGKRGITICSGSVRVKKLANGSIVAQRGLIRTHAELVTEWKSAGFRFPTSNEWEYVCGGGSQTLFRWGDHVPCDHYPIDNSRWTQHRRPSILGVLIASNPYMLELVAESGITRGGDGGSAICGGAGFFDGWLPLATAYFAKHACKRDPLKPISNGYTFGRRVIELS